MMMSENASTYLAAADELRQKFSVECSISFLTSGTLGHWRNLKGSNLKPFYYDFDQRLEATVGITTLSS